tara:strand:+ start:177 stop:758 length:582 start_codon:yes stop_codon:yes gene_type:complete
MGVFIGPNSGTPESTHESAWVRITTVTSGSTINDITIEGLDTSVYRAWMLIGGVMPGTDNAYINFYWRVGGSDMVANKYAYSNNVTYPTDTAYQVSAQDQGRMQIAQNGGNDSSNREGHRFQIFMFPYVSGHAVQLGNFCYWNSIRIDDDGDFRGIVGQGLYDVDNIYPDGFKLMPSTGQFNDYNYSLYGLLV